MVYYDTYRLLGCHCIMIKHVSEAFLPPGGIDAAAAAAKRPRHYLFFLPSMENMRILALSPSLLGYHSSP